MTFPTSEIFSIEVVTRWLLTNHDPLEAAGFVVSMVIALLSAVIACASILKATKANAIAKEANRLSEVNAGRQAALELRTQALEERGQHAAHLASYTNWLMDADTEVRAATNELGAIARHCLHIIGSCLNDNARYDANLDASRNTRETFNELCSLLFVAFKNELIHKKGLRVRRLYIDLRNLPAEKLSISELDELKQSIGDDEIHVAQMDQSKLAELGDRVFRTAEFRLLAHDIYLRAPIDDPEKFLEKILRILEPYFLASERLRPVFIKNHIFLEKKYEQNIRFDLIKITELAILNKQFKKGIAATDVLSNLHIEEIQRERNWNRNEAIQVIIYIGAVLEALGEHESWASLDNVEPT